MRCWVKQHPISEKRKEAEESPAALILKTEPKLKANFTIPAALRSIKKACRYQQNPEPYWGPKQRATGKKRAADDGAGGGGGGGGGGDAARARK